MAGTFPDMTAFMRVDPQPRENERKGLPRRLAAHVALTAALVLGWGATAHAATCLEQTRQLAGSFNLSIDPPAAEPGRQSDRVTTEELSESGGVIAPPPARDPAVIEAPEPGRQTMPTVPDIQPETPPPSGGRGALDPAARATLQSILVAAGAEARRGREEDCFSQLSKAKAYIARQRG